MLSLLALLFFSVAQSMQVGTSRVDITGPVAEMPMMGYGTQDHRAHGLHTRLYARAFVIEKNEQRMAYVIADLGMISEAVRLRVAEILDTQLPGVFSDDNVMISATHTHAGPGGYFHERLYVLATLGFSQKNFAIITYGIASAIINAYQKRQSGSARFSQAELTDASINQSLVPYAQNVDAKDYRHSKNTTMSQIELFHGDNISGLFNWFAVHATTLSKAMKLVSGDNKGVASLEMEKILVPKAADVVAGFGNGDEGDISSAVIHYDERMNDLDKTDYVAMKQVEKSRSMYNSDQKINLTSIIESRMKWVTMPGLVVRPEFTGLLSETALCAAALGYSFAAGSEDGRSMAPFFLEGMRSDHLTSLPPFYLSMALVLLGPVLKSTKEINDCHFPKPVLITTGARKKSWTPQTLPFQLMRVGEIMLVGVPGEMTTMSGRRLRRDLENILQPHGIKHVVIVGLANSYAGYITTPEEYQLQHYEGASTHFGPHTLNAYRQILSDMAREMLQKNRCNPIPDRV